MKILQMSITALMLACCNSKHTANVEDRSFPTALVPGLEVSKLADCPRRTVQVLIDPMATDYVWFICFDGNVYKRNLIDQFEEKVLTSAEHGITKLQGGEFLGKSLFLSGNLTNGLGNIGRMVRFTFDDSGDYQMTTVFQTVEYGTNRTAFDHGWNSITTSPDKKFIYVNSGSRTDHGEVQDNNGNFPNARDGALTAKIFRFPANATNLILPDDERYLKDQNYIYAEGIRNAFGLAFNFEGKLFAAVNSGDYDHSEDMFWIRQGHHYGFPWIMGGTENPQQFIDWRPDVPPDPFLNSLSHAFKMKYFRNDPNFPRNAREKRFTRGILNLGPDANEYRDTETGKILDADETGFQVTTFTAHSSPVGLVFDTKETLPLNFKGAGFILRYSSPGMPESLLEPFTKEGGDLLLLRLTYDKNVDNYKVVTKRIVTGFNGPSDCVLLDENLYIVEFNDSEKGRFIKVQFK